MVAELDEVAEIDEVAEVDKMDEVDEVDDFFSAMDDLLSHCCEGTD